MYYAVTEKKIKKESKIQLWVTNSCYIWHDQIHHVSIKYVKILSRNC